MNLDKNLKHNRKYRNIFNSLSDQYHSSERTEYQTDQSLSSIEHSRSLEINNKNTNNAIFQKPPPYDDKRFSLPVIKARNSKIVLKLLQSLTPQRDRNLSLPARPSLSIFEKIDQ